MTSFIKSIRRSKCYLNTFRFLDYISLGKYKSILYLERKNSKSSGFGGCLTILWILAIIGFTYVTLKAVFEESTFSLTSKSKVLSFYKILDTTKPINQSDF
jgi:hypothetical protein